MLFFTNHLIPCMAYRLPETEFWISNAVNLLFASTVPAFEIFVGRVCGVEA
jgi:hypothetical protein